MLELTTLNKISIGLLFLAKFSGLMAVCVGFGGFATLGSILLLVAGISLLTIFVFCGLQMRNQKNDTDEAILTKLMLNGTLKNKLQAIGYTNV